MYTTPSQADDPPKAVPLSLNIYALCGRATFVYGSWPIKVSAESVRPSTRQKVLVGLAQPYLNLIPTWAHNHN